MLALIEYNLVTLAVALLIGIGTGWWAFRRPAGGTAEKKAEDPNAT